MKRKHKLVERNPFDSTGEEVFHDIEPRLSVIELLSYLYGKIRVAGRMRKEVSRPIAWCNAVAAPHAHCSYRKILNRSFWLMKELREKPTRYRI